MIAIMGGLLLISGAYFTYMGKIFNAVLFYAIADVCWVIIAYSSGNIIGAVFVLIGLILGILAFLKMNNGIMRKTLDP